jgi:transcriptional regulator
MYVHPAFHVDRGAGLSFAAERGFGTVIACDGGRPVASPLPFHISYAPDGTPRVAFHVARANPLAALAEAGGTWLISVMGADAYVSPDWYASPDQVPTWLYQSVQLSGPVRATAVEALPHHLDDLSAQFEAWLAPKPVWTADKITPGRRKMLMKAIVGIEMHVETVEGSLKLNQHKSDADQAAVAAALRSRPDGASRELAARMIAMRPHLTYEDARSPPSLAATGAQGK